MKKVWRMNDNAVSPVIATILMVAITVVLAAVLYVMVMGMTPDHSAGAPQASLNADENRLVLSISRTYDIDDGILQVAIDDGAKTNLVNGTISGAITFVDSGGDGKIGNGDYFENSDASTSTIKILWTSGDVSELIAEGEI